ncbi:MAG TPA: hypothetical protein VH253_11610 [Phycisphaerae bacterium]|nr:hypothetical protein [Phycisphaerae bacterium]
MLREMQLHLEQAASGLGGVGAELVYEVGAGGAGASYARSLARAKGEAVVFVAQGGAFLTVEGLGRLVGLLGEYAAVGVAGAMRVVDGEWCGAGPPYVYGQYVDGGKGSGAGGKAEARVVVWSVPERVMGGMAVLCPAVVAARREAMERVGFDAVRFESGEMALTDAGYRMHVAGGKLAAACDVPAVWNAGIVESRERAAFVEKHGLSGEGARQVVARVGFADVGEAVGRMAPGWWAGGKW